MCSARVDERSCWDVTYQLCCCGDFEHGQGCCWSTLEVHGLRSLGVVVQAPGSVIPCRLCVEVGRSASATALLLQRRALDRSVTARLFWGQVTRTDRSAVEHFRARHHRQQNRFYASSRTLVLFLFFLLVGVLSSFVERTAAAAAWAESRGGRAEGDLRRC